MSLGNPFQPSNTTSTIALGLLTASVSVSGQGNCVWVAVTGNTAGAWVSLGTNSSLSLTNTTGTNSQTVGMLIPPATGMLISAPWEPTGATGGFLLAASTNTAGWVAATPGWGTAH
jgi:hypothetical protein